jgi:hypothetical protein
VAGTAQICGQRRQVIVLRDLPQGARKTKAQVIPVQALLNLSEDLR